MKVINNRARQYNFVSKQGNKNISTVRANNCSANSFSVITFSGTNRNSKQIAFISLESVPINKNGGMADVVGELPPSLNKKGYDARVIIPLFNALDGVKSKNGKPIYIEPKGKEFQLKDLDISFDYKYGVHSSKAKIYKIEDERVKFPVYVIHCPDTISKNKTEYQGWVMDQMKNQSSFCKASLEALKRLDNETEKFKPKFVMSHDWTSALVMNYMSEDPYFKDAKKVHSVLNLGQFYQGMLAAPVAAPYILSKKELKKVTNDENMRYLLEEFNKAVNSRAGEHSNLSIDQDIKSKNYDKAFLKISENYEKYIPYTTNHLGFIDNRLIQICPDKMWHNGIYNCSVAALKEADSVVVCSDEYLKDLQNEDAYTGGLADLMQSHKIKSYGITIGMDYVLNNPADTIDINPKALKYPFSFNTKEINPAKNIYAFKTGKEKNKEYLQEILGENSFDSAHQNHFSNFKQYGHLKKDKNAMLSVFITRFDPLQKGVDIAAKAAEEFLEKNKKAQIVLAGPNFEPTNFLIQEYLDKVVEKYPGRAVLCNGFINNINQFYAGADAVLIPSRFAPFELVQVLGMRMGAIPIVSNTGGLKEVVIDASHPNKNKTIGFKTQIPLLLAENPVEEYSKTMQRAHDTYYNDKKHWNRLTENSLKYRLEWSLPTKNYINNIFNLKNYSNISNLTYIDKKLFIGGKIGGFTDNKSEVQNIKRLNHDLKFLSKKGVTNIINLDKFDEIQEKYAKEANFKYHNIKLDNSKMPSLSDLLNIFNIIDKAEGTTLIQDKNGKEVTNLIATFYTGYKTSKSPGNIVSKSGNSFNIKPFGKLNHDDSAQAFKLLESLSRLGEKFNHNFEKLNLEELENELKRPAEKISQDMRPKLIAEYKASKIYFEAIKFGKYYL